MSFRFYGAAAYKLAWRCVPFATASTDRVDAHNDSQVIRMYMDPDVVFVDPVTKASVSIGSSRNADTMDPNDYDMVVNCAPSEIKISHTRLKELDLRDDNKVVLDFDELHALLAEVKPLLTQQQSRIMVHCWMGASRSVAVACFLLAAIYGPTKRNAAEDFDFFYHECRKFRPSVNVSVRLRDQAILSLHRLRGTKPPAPPLEKTAEETAEQTTEEPAETDKKKKTD